MYDWAEDADIEMGCHMLNLSPNSLVLLPALAKISCEPNWRWQKREKPMPNYDLFYVWSGQGWLELNDKTYEIGKGSCFLFRPGDHPTATHNPQKPLVLTYIHFDVTEPVEIIPKSYRVCRRRSSSNICCPAMYACSSSRLTRPKKRPAHPQIAAYPSPARRLRTAPREKSKQSSDGDDT